MKSFFFGKAKGLYGTLHEPAGATKDLGVVLCYPGPPEYHMTYWAFRRLAQQLSRAGLATLRFDYSCTGDSAGEATDGRIEAWADDIATAAAELKDLTGLRKLALVGMRLGAVLAARAVARGLKVSHLVLWEPVIDGKSYLRQLEALDAREAMRLLHRVTEPRIELGGYRLTSAQRGALERLDLSADVPRAASRVVFACPKEQEAEVAAVNERWSAAGANGTVCVVSDQASVTGSADRDTAVRYTGALQVMTEQLTSARSAA